MAPAVRVLCFLGVSPNLVTFASLVIALGAGVAITIRQMELAIFLWWCGRYLDGADGEYARASGRATPFGALWDLTADMCAYAAMILAFSWSFPSLWLYWELILFLYLMCSSTALALGSLERECKIPQHDNRGLRLGAGLAEAGETGIAYTLFMLFPFYLPVLVVGWIFVLCLTVAFRLRLAAVVLRRVR
jgi:phosphatidylglycerophosphate synthase